MGQWQAMQCPSCDGVGCVNQYNDWDDHGRRLFTGTATCKACDGKKFVRIDVASLKEFPSSEAED